MTVSPPAKPAPVILTVVPVEPKAGETVTDEPVVIRPIELLCRLVNHSAPSGPAAIPTISKLLASLYRVITPAVLIRQIQLW